MSKHNNVVKSMVEVNSAGLKQAVLIQAGQLGFAALEESFKSLPEPIKALAKHPLARLFMANMVTYSAERYNLDASGYMSAAMNAAAMNDVVGLMTDKVYESIRTAVDGAVASDQMPIDGQVVQRRSSILGNTPKFSGVPDGDKGSTVKVEHVVQDLTKTSPAPGATTVEGQYRPVKPEQLRRNKSGKYDCPACNGEDKQGKFAILPSGEFKGVLGCRNCMKKCLDEALAEKKATEAATKAVEQAKADEARLLVINERIAVVDKKFTDAEAYAKKLEIEIDKNPDQDEPKEFLSITNAKLEKLNEEMITLLDEQKELMEKGKPAEVKASPVPVSKGNNAIANVKNGLRKSK